MMISTVNQATVKELFGSSGRRKNNLWALPEAVGHDEVSGQIKDFGRNQQFVKRPHFERRLWRCSLLAAGDTEAEEQLPCGCMKLISSSSTSNSLPWCFTELIWELDGVSLP